MPWVGIGWLASSTRSMPFAARLPIDYIKVGKSYHVVDASAEQYVCETLIGVQRYTKEYYGPFLYRILAEVFGGQKPPSWPSLNVVASHAPLDINFRPQITTALRGEHASCLPHGFAFAIPGRGALALETNRGRRSADSGDGRDSPAHWPLAISTQGARSS